MAASVNEMVTLGEFLNNLLQELREDFHLEGGHGYTLWGFGPEDLRDAFRDMLSKLPLKEKRPLLKATEDIEEQIFAHGYNTLALVVKGGMVYGKGARVLLKVEPDVVKPLQG